VTEPDQPLLADDLSEPGVGAFQRRQSVG